MKSTAFTRATGVARIFFGLVFTVFGLNGFLQFIPMPQPPEAAGAFLGALAATSYMFPLIKGTEVVAGLLLLAGRAVPLALILLAPIVVNIAFFHLVLDPALITVAVLVGLHAFLGYAYRDSFAPLFRKGEPRAAEAVAPGVPLAAK